MYVSVDSLPELTPEYQQTQQQAVRDAKVVYQFEVVKVSPTDYGTIFIWSLFGLGSLWLVWNALSDGFLGALLILIFSGGILTYFYYAGNPDVKQTVTLTEKGMIVSELQLVPDACFAALRYSGYVGIGISVVGVVLVGPMMFIGAGAGLLMSFKMAGVENRPKNRVRPFHPDIEYVMADNLCAKFKNDLTLRRVVPRIELENDGGVKDELFSRNKEFYFLTYASTEQQQDEVMRHLKKFINVEKGEY
ncbi:conserved membrane hypothetical protein [Vibrio jasicida]|uniref:Uncharacterized protein n=1 Tax=Vibrio jasicida TaxID=766224 RepID=A0AAU9QS05_9VIBR|nr:conserved membrane hypothetical protein [Vibrio jasicida]CAH1596520.1 conserved membrane hypothetical protein [Vibrio jasicida]